MGKMKKKDEQGIVPKHIEQGQEGMENVEQSDLIIPRLVIMQALSPLVENGEKKPGEIVNSLTGETWIGLEEQKNFIPVYHFKEWIHWGDRDSNEGILDRSLDPESDLAISVKRGEKNEKGKMKITEYHNFIAVFPEHGIHQPVIVPCCRSNHKHGRALIGLAKYRGSHPLYAGVYNIGTQKEENQQGQKYFAFQFENDGWVPENQYEEVKDFYQLIKSMAWKDAGPVEEVDTAPVSDEL